MAGRWPAAILGLALAVVLASWSPSASALTGARPVPVAGPVLLSGDRVAWIAPVGQDATRLRVYTAAPGRPQQPGALLPNLGRYRISRLAAWNGWLTINPSFYDYDGTLLSSRLLAGPPEGPLHTLIDCRAV